MITNEVNEVNLILVFGTILVVFKFVHYFIIRQKTSRKCKFLLLPFDRYVGGFVLIFALTNAQNKKKITIKHRRLYCIFFFVDRRVGFDFGQS